MTDLSTQDPVLARLAAANPADLGEGAALLGPMEAEIALGRILRAPRGRRSRLRRRIVPAAAIVSAGLAAGAWVIVAGGDGADGPFPALEQAAAAAEAAPAPDPALGSVRLERARAAYLVTVAASAGHDGYSALVPRTIASWARPNGSVTSSQQAGEPIFLGPADEEAWRAAGSPPLAARGASEDEREKSIADLDALAVLASSPGELLAAVRAQGGEPSADPQVTLTRIADLLRDPAASPELRAGLYRALGLVEGLRAEEDVRDPLGRSGVAFGVEGSSSGARTLTRLVFDPASSRLLAEETVLLERVAWLDAEPPVRIGWRAVLGEELVARVGQRGA